MSLPLIADTLMGIAYYAIACSLIYFLQKRKDIPFTSIFLLFVAFIVVGGTNHFIDVWTLWHPDYWLSGTVKVITAGIVVSTALQLIPVIPQVLDLPSPAHLEQINQQLQQLQQEISERKQAEQQLQQLNQFLGLNLRERTAALVKQEIQLHAFLDNATDLIQSVSPEGKILFVNQAWKTTLGYNDADVDQMSVSRIIHPDEIACFQSVIQQLLTTPGDVIAVETKFIAKDGREILVEGNINCQLENGQPVALRWILNDVTQYKKATEELQNSKLFLELILNTIPLYIFWKDQESVYQGCNERWATMAGLASSEQVVGMTDQQLPWTDDEREWYLRCDRKVLTTGQSLLNIQGQQTQADGQQKWRQANKVPIRDATGQIVGLLGIIADITKRQHTGGQLQQYTSQLEVANQELEAFTYSVSHDLRAPLRAINGFSQALLEDYGDTLDETGKDYCNRIRKNASRMGLLIDNLLTLSRVARAAMHYVTINLSDLVQELASELQTSAPHRSVEWIIAPDALVYADANLMRIVLNNLLQNAWKFTSYHPTARIEFGVLQQDEDPIYFIQDDGAGFDLAYIQMLFRVFQRLHTIHEFPGTGIGLATVERAIHRHGGKVWAEGAVEQGATFYFTIPKYLHSVAT
ncbi:sensor histidine kinase [Leptolyngbya sp. Heron Island J]|uniref:sensor histidine kinase n=1 Tax=Leptolyngbya sp. Heron Island J TaxID=1385935 RepID=UPI0013775EAB|nr:PAS domain-containing sensor histidine kinase [Leptolyngbya sp. Heron Island J]